jgi:hypothetical protein
MILPVVLYGCETWSLTLREEHRLRVFENRVLRGIFGPKRDEVTGEWRIRVRTGMEDKGSLAGCCKCGNEPSFSGATELVRIVCVCVCVCT